MKIIKKDGLQFYEYVYDKFHRVLFEKTMYDRMTEFQKKELIVNQKRMIENGILFKKEQNE
jgi:hypothetical protein